MPLTPEEIWGSDALKPPEQLKEQSQQTDKLEANTVPPQQERPPLTTEERRQIYNEEKAKRSKRKFLIAALIVISAFAAYQVYRLISVMREYEEATKNAKQASADTAAVVSKVAPSEPPEYESIRQKLLDGGDSENAIRNNILAIDPKITYELLKKNSDKYKGQPWGFSGKIRQIFEKDGRTDALLSLDYWGNKLVWVTGDFTTDFVQNNQVYVVGYIAGDYSYTSIANYQMNMPLVAARAMLKPSAVAKIKSKD
jgi:hypothetical protein